MEWSFTTNTRYHQQDTNYYCGAASSQMVLNSMGIGLNPFGYGLIPQGEIFGVGQTFKDTVKWPGTWSMDPESVKDALNWYSKPVLSAFVVVEGEDAAEVLNKIVASIFSNINNNIPVPVVVYKDAGHWIVVKGMNFDGEPVNGQTGTLLGLFVNNPWPPVPSFYSTLYCPPPPPHDDNDKCGSANEHTFGNSREYASCLVNGWWWTHYFTGAILPPDPLPRWIAICHRIIVRPFRILLAKDDKIRRRLTMIGPEEIIELLIPEIERHGLCRNELFSEALEGARPSKPILVKRLDEADSYYYLVHMKKDTKVTAMVSIDAMSGQLGGCVAYPQPIKKPFITRKDAVKRITGRSIDLGDDKGKIELFEGKFKLEPDMVWKPCKETLSPYYPLYVATTATNQQVYIDYMGNVYTELHDVGPAAKKNNLK